MYLEVGSAVAAAEATTAAPATNGTTGSAGTACDLTSTVRVVDVLAVVITLLQDDVDILLVVHAESVAVVVVVGVVRATSK